MYLLTLTNVIPRVPITIQTHTNRDLNVRYRLRVGVLTTCNNFIDINMLFDANYS